jgi:hypothetical protein
MALVEIAGPTIAAGQSLSDGIDTSAGRLVRINTPPEWTPAHLTFLVSTDGGGYSSLYKGGSEAIIPYCGPNRAIFVIPEDWPSLVWLQFRSGTQNGPVPQEAERVFSIVIETP